MGGWRSSLVDGELLGVWVVGNSAGRVDCDTQ